MRAVCMGMDRDQLLQRFPEYHDYSDDKGSLSVGRGYELTAEAAGRHVQELLLSVLFGIPWTGRSARPHCENRLITVAVGNRSTSMSGHDLSDMEPHGAVVQIIYEVLLPRVDRYNLTAEHPQTTVKQSA